MRQPVESPQLMSLAFRDAVRDILHLDGLFRLADEDRDDVVWEWDGVRWRRLPLDEQPTEPTSYEHAPM